MFSFIKQMSDKNRERVFPVYEHLLNNVSLKKDS